MSADEESQDQAAREEAWYERKSQLMEEWLGREYELVLHAMVPFALGGALDLYYYPHGLPGTAIATKELSPLPGEGPSNEVHQSYELVMFTRQPLHLDDVDDEATPFGRIHRIMSTTLNLLAFYAQEETLNPGDTVSFPEDAQVVGGRCFLLDDYGRGEGEQEGEFGLLLVMQIFPTELKFAHEHGTRELIARLKAQGAYPYSDLEREPVV